MTRASRQGVYLRLNLRAARTPIYVGSVAGEERRNFATRDREHLRKLAQGTHHNTALQRVYNETGGKGELMIPIAVVTGETPAQRIAQARKIESAIIKALGRACCNERR